MTLVRRGSARKKHEARLAWLKPNVGLYPDVPGIHDDVTPAGRVALDRLCARMHALDLFGTSAPTTQRETARRLLSELRGEHIGGGW